MTTAEKIQWRHQVRPRTQTHSRGERETQAGKQASTLLPIRRRHYADAHHHQNRCGCQGV